MAEGYDNMMGSEQDVSSHDSSELGTASPVAYKPGDKTTHTVTNRSTGKTTYHDSLRAASRASDNQDNKYGAYITHIQQFPKLVPIDEE